MSERSYSKHGVAPSHMSSEEFYKRTLSRLNRVRSQLDTTLRGSKLQGKTCIITGAGSLKGIGRASALLFAHHGAKHLYLLDFDYENLPELKSTIETRYPDVKVTIMQADAADEEAIDAVCKKALHEEGRLDVFFANAGIAMGNLLHDISADQFMEIMRVNTLSCFLAVKHGSAAMLETNAPRGKDEPGGSIILTASVAGLASGAGTIDYSASKAAVNSIAKTSPYQIPRTNIRVNSICPGIIETSMTAPTFDFARKRGSETKIGQLNPLGRYGVPQEVANVALFLASDDSSYVNGQNWAVDGGITSSMPTVPGRLM